jgi:hypothetical protein
VLKLFQNQQPHFITSLHQVVRICEEIADDRRAHIEAIETARNKKIFDVDKQYQTEVLEQQGKLEHDEYIRSVKQTVFGATNIQSCKMATLAKLLWHQHLPDLIRAWVETQTTYDLLVLKC